MNFENRRQLPFCAEINQYDIVDFLSTIGHHPAKIKGQNYWYYSPLRIERTPSFKVNRKLNRWYDFGTGKGSTLVDFGIMYFECTIRELLQILSSKVLDLDIVAHFNSYVPATPEPKISIENISTLHSSFLIHYLHARRINLNVAQKFCGEANFRIDSKSYYAISFKNNVGGFELRNKYFKGSSSPKGITLIDNNCPLEIAVFEGFFDFLSWLTILAGDTRLHMDYLSLNSTAFFEKNISFIEKYKIIHLFLDNDKEGERITRIALKRSKAYVDQRKLYASYKDLNDFLCNKPQPIQIHKISAE